MKTNLLVLRGLLYYWRTNAAVVAGVATAVAVLSGALVVGDSVRGSLRDLVLQRLGRTDHIVVSEGFFRERLAEDVRTNPGFAAEFDEICPLIIVQGFVSRQTGGGRAGKVHVYGVDNRFWQFHRTGENNGPEGRDALISPALARELGAEAGATILVRVQRPSDIPLESLHSRKDDLGRTVRATVRAVVPREALGEFSLQAQQGDVRAVFLPLSRLQEEMDSAGRVNALLVSAKTPSARSSLERIVRDSAQLEDLGLALRTPEGRQAISMEPDSGLLDPEKSNAAFAALLDMRLQPQPVFTYLANSLRAGEREIPYSLVSAVDIPEIAPSPDASGPPPILLNDWAARDLRAAKGDRVTMEYYVWEEPGRLVTRTVEFQVAGVVAIDPRDRDLAPVYPGITESRTLGDWDPPFPIDLRKIRPVDEEYWEAHRTTPKAFIHFAIGHQLWRSRYGSMTSIRFTPEPGQPIDAVQQDYARRLREKLDPLAAGLAVAGVRDDSIEASRGATNFGEYFVYFSFFIVASALLLAALFFKLNIEQRAHQVGLFRAVGFNPAAVRRIFMTEGLLLSVAGAAVGVIGGLLYGNLMVTALRTWWVDAVGTTAITLHVSLRSLAAGALGGILAAMACIWATLRGLANVSERRLLAGQLAAEPNPGRKDRLMRRTAIVFAALGVALMAATAAGLIEQAVAFFGAGSALLAACLCFFVFVLGAPARHVLDGGGVWAVSRLGLRSARYRPARSVLSIAMIASATFILISVDAFRRDDTSASADIHSGTGGYSLLVESLLPLVHDPASREGRETLGLADVESVSMEPFRLRPGDDASCLNLYAPGNPRILGAGNNFIAEGRFAFQSSLASNDGEDENPWLLLHRKESDDAVPVIADANSMTYVLHRKLGDDIVIRIADRDVRLRFVAALDDSIFQGELLMSEANFRNLFPEQEGYRLFLVQTMPDQTAAVESALESALTDLGAVATPAAQRLAEFHRVENTYLSTFQMLGGLGLLLGTAGLGAALMRNVFERRRELAFLRAVGYRQSQFFTMVIAENIFLLTGGLLTGALCALLAIAPVLLERGGRLPALSMVALPAAVLAAGLIVSVVATAAALRSPLLSALRSE